MTLKQKGRGGVVERIVIGRMGREIGRRRRPSQVRTIKRGNSAAAEALLVGWAALPISPHAHAAQFETPAFSCAAGVSAYEVVVGNAPNRRKRFWSDVLVRIMPSTGNSQAVAVGIN